MKILVTGATGFIGDHLVNELLKDKNNKIIATSRDIEKALKCDWFSKVNYIPYDISTTQQINLFEYFNEPDRMIHLAWEGLPNYNALTHIEKNLFYNYNFLKNLIVNGVKDITMAGTCFEYGMVNGCLSEEMITNPSNSYAVAKDALRKMIEELSKHCDFTYKWVRIFYMYGEKQSATSLISLLDKAIDNGDDEFNMSSGEQLRDYLHVSEVAKNLSIICKYESSNQLINCCSGEAVSVRKLVEDRLQERGYSMKLNLGYYPYPDYEPMAFWGNNKKLNQIKEDSESRN